VLGGGVGVVVVVLLLAGAVAVGAAKLSNIAREDVDLAEALQGEPENYLVVGSDSRAVVQDSDPDASAFLGEVGAEPTGQRSDTILVVRVDPRADQVQVLSLPRDLWVPIAGTGENDRINAAYSLGGAQRLVDTIREDFGIEIHHYLEVDFASFKGVVDAVGGVPMWFDTRMRDTNSGLVIDKPGCHTLDGEAALAFARSRHLQYDAKGRWVDDPTGDLGRISRQQFLIRRMFDLAAAKVRSIDVRGTNDLIDAGTRNLTVDRQLDVKKLVALSRKLSSGSADEVLVTHSLPSIQWATPGGASVLKMHPAEAQPILNVFRGLPADTIPPSEVRFSVLNATGTRGRAAAIKDDFRPTGFVVTATEETGGTNTRSVVRYGPGNLRMAQEVARHLVGGADLVEDDDLNERIMLIAGKDYAGVTTDARPLDQLTTTTTTSSSSGRSSSSSSSGRGSSSTSTTAPTTTTTAALGDGLGQVPGRPPDGVTCS
jgi:LCP family protein required for cell wall assembly